MSVTSVKKDGSRGVDASRTGAAKEGSDREARPRQSVPPGGEFLLAIRAPALGADGSGSGFPFLEAPPLSCFENHPVV